MFNKFPFSDIGQSQVHFFSLLHFDPNRSCSALQQKTPNTWRLMIKLWIVQTQVTVGRVSIFGLLRMSSSLFTPWESQPLQSAFQSALGQDTEPPDCPQGNSYWCKSDLHSSLYYFTTSVWTGEHDNCCKAFWGVSRPGAKLLGAILQTVCYSS